MNNENDKIKDEQPSSEQLGLGLISSPSVEQGTIENKDPIWEILPNETRKQYFAFQCYMETGTLRKAYLLYRARRGKPIPERNQRAIPSAFFSWSKKFFWEQRLRAFERHVREENWKRISKNRQEEFEARTAIYNEIAKQAHMLILERLACKHLNRNTKITDILEVVKHYDQEHINELERRNVIKLQDLIRMSNEGIDTTTV